jgi:hypothetical protein
VSSSSSNIIKSGHKRKEPASLSHSLKDHPPNEIAGFRRVYRWSTGCSSVRPGGGLLRFLPNGVDARGGSTDPDSEFAFVFFFFFFFFLGFLFCFSSVSSPRVFVYTLIEHARNNKKQQTVHSDGRTLRKEASRRLSIATQQLCELRCCYCPFATKGPSLLGV